MFTTVKWYLWCDYANSDVTRIRIGCNKTWIEMKPTDLKMHVAVVSRVVAPPALHVLCLHFFAYNSCPDLIY